MAEYYYSDDLNQSLREQKRIPLMTDEDRKKVQFIVINSDFSARQFYDSLRQRAQVNGKFLPAIQDNQNKLIAAISGSSGKSTSGNKDHMALLDKHGRVLAYFRADQSFMGNMPNQISRAVEAVIRGDTTYMPLCPPIGGGGEPVDPVKKPECNPVDGKQVGSVARKAFKAKTACECHDKCATEYEGFNYRLGRERRGKMTQGKCMCLKDIRDPGRKLKGRKKWNSQKY